MATTEPAANWGTIDLAAGRTTEFVFELYEGDPDVPLPVEATDLFRFFLWDTDSEAPSDLNTNSGPGSDTFTADNATNTFTSSAAHKLDNGTAVQLSNSGGALPAELAEATTYWVIGRTSTTFQLAATRGGSAISISDDGTGTHTWTKGSTITVNTVGVAGTTPAKVTVKFHQWDTATLAVQEYTGALVLVDDDDGDTAKECGRGVVNVLGSGGGELGLGG